MANRELYNSLLKNLTDFYVNTTVETKIKFIYYDAKNLNVPKTNEYFRTITFEKTPLYFVRGKDINFMYVYTKESITKIIGTSSLIKPYNSSKNTYTKINNVTILPVTDKTIVQVFEAYIGHHLDFAITPQKNGDVLFKTHKTVYEIDDETLYAKRFTDNCNFTWKKDKYRDVNDIRCETITSQVPIQYLSPQSVYTPDQYKGFRLLYNATIGNNPLSVVHAGTRGGKFVMRGGTRSYIKQQKGGTTLDNDKLFVIQQELLIPVHEKRSNLFAVQIIHDTIDNHNNVLIMYEFIEPDQRKMYYVNYTLIKDVTDVYKKIRDNIRLEPIDNNVLRSFSAARNVIVDGVRS